MLESEGAILVVVGAANVPSTFYLVRGHTLHINEWPLIHTQYLI